MKDSYQIMIVDDCPNDIRVILDNVQQLVLKRGYKVDFSVLSRKKEIEQINTQMADIVMFDCAMSAGDFDFSQESEAKYGLRILKKYREINKRVKIIFYSGSFMFDDEESITLTTEEFIDMINDLNVFAIVNRDPNMITEYVVKAIEQMEPVLTGMEYIIHEYGDQGEFVINGEVYSSEEIMKELRLGTTIGEEFRKQINEIILTYLMKFKG